MKGKEEEAKEEGNIARSEGEEGGQQRGRTVEEPFTSATSATSATSQPGSRRFAVGPVLMYRISCIMNLIF